MARDRSASTRRLYLLGIAVLFTSIGVVQIWLPSSVPASRTVHAAARAWARQ